MERLIQSHMGETHSFERGTATDGHKDQHTHMAQTPLQWSGYSKNKADMFVSVILDCTGVDGSEFQSSYFFLLK